MGYWIPKARTTHADWQANLFIIEKRSERGLGNEPARPKKVEGEGLVN